MLRDVLCDTKQGYKKEKKKKIVELGNPSEP
jgi:hypothetical protein